MGGETGCRIGGRATPTRARSSRMAMEMAIDLMIQIHRQTPSHVPPSAGVDGAG